MGNKVSAITAMRKAGVPTVPVLQMRLHRKMRWLKLKKLASH
jgi:biotin carboxylase